MKFHPIADIFPLLEGEEFDALVEDIRERGQREPIVLYQNQILDGRNRHRACLEAGIACWFEEYDGDDPLAFVISLNLKRRHLSESQRAMVAAKLATLKRGDNQHSPIGETSQARAAELLNVGKRSVERAHDVQQQGAPELIHAVESDKVSVSAAADVATLPIEQQQEIVAKGEREILEAAKSIRARKAADRHADSIKRIAEISKGTRGLPSGQRYPLIYADPAWYFAAYDSVTGNARNPEGHYPCMRTEDICAMPVRELATNDAVLFLWTTAPHLEEAFRVIDAWGFRYASNIVWVKDQIGLGFYLRNQHELLLIATRGDIPCPLPANRPASVIEAPRREHSRKPDEAYELVERMYGELPKIELFARGKREGWAAWGNQAAPPDDGLDIPESLRRVAP
jgi:N6-adenosine-specific RNA methylase IME4/ParB-like chromosome segregation protein Spo0J